MIELPTDSPRFLISRMSAIGDTILTLPVLCAIRNRFPKAHITWIVERKSAGVVEGHSDLDELIVLDRLWFKSPSRLRQIRGRLRASQFDVTVDAQSKFKSALACWLSGAAVRIGCQGKYGQEFSTWLNNTLIEPRRPHLVDRTLELLQPLGINSPAIEFRLPIKSDDIETIDRFINASYLGCGFAVINPGASWESKLWPIERFGRVARELGERQHLPSVVAWAGDQERQWAQAIVAGSGGHALMAPHTSLGALAALLDRSCMYIGNDTGPMHIAVAVDTPCVCLHGPTRPEDSGPHGKQHIPIIERYQAGSSRQRRRAGNDAMRLIQVDRVVRACEEILQRDSSNNNAA